ncbi:MAG TPA: hypothetical protein VMB71_05815 [Acetobacteraceae bacterium]|nr:hypothetical protein [Acetobacteraceae bacterium]
MLQIELAATALRGSGLPGFLRNFRAIIQWSALRWRARGPGEIVAWAVTALVLVLFVLGAGRRIEQADDAFISYRYAVNLATGHGLVYNPGEYVEGFTNLLWTLLIALWVRIGVQAPSAGQAMSLLFGALSLVGVHIYVRRFLPPRFAWLAALAPVVMLASNSFACWTTTGLETPLFLFLTIAGLLAFDMQRQIATAWISVLALLCRPEGGIMAGVLLGVPWIIGLIRWSDGWRGVLRRSVPPLIFVAALAALTAWRYYYYGDVVPNTFHAKVGQVPLEDGVFYIEKFFSDGPLLLLPGAMLAIILEPRLRAPALFGLATTVYCVAIGGDVFAFGRFMLPVLPVLLAAASVGAERLLAWRVWLGIALALALPATALVSLYGEVSPPGFHLANDFDLMGPVDEPFPRLGKRARAERHWFREPNEKHFIKAMSARMRKVRPGVKLVACIGIGKIGYYNMDLRILDMVGLTDRRIALSQRTVPGAWIIPGHSRTDSDYVLSRRPDIIIMRNAPSPGLLPAIADLLGNPGLKKLYWFDSVNKFWIAK